MYKIIDDFNIELSIEEVLKGQGIEPSRASERLVENAKSIISLAHELIKPVALTRTLTVKEYYHQQIFFEDGSFKGGLVARALAGAEQLVLVVCTIGSALENKVMEIMNDDPVMAVTLDGAGIAGIRQVSGKVEKLLLYEAKDMGLTLGMRASPGQEEWPIEQQRELFSHLPADQIGVQLTDSCLMLPRKSVSFVIPRGKNISSDKIPCHFCTKRSGCKWRKDI